MDDLVVFSRFERVGALAHRVLHPGRGVGGNALREHDAVRSGDFDAVTVAECAAYRGYARR